jgi:hypothetical protein
MRIFEMNEKEDDELLTEINVTLSNFPILMEIYDEDFCLNLIKKKTDCNNYLLWLLASRTDYAKTTWESISKCLELLKDADSISHFRDKLRHMKEMVFHSYQTELELAGYYKEKGYDVELEPQISGTNKNPDFKVENENIQIFFEIGNLFTDRLIQMQRLEDQLHERFHKIEDLFVFSIYYQSPPLRIRHLKPLGVFLRKKFAELDKKDNIEFPLTSFFPNQINHLAEVKIWEKSKREYGYLRSFMSTVPQLHSGGKNFRRKISKKISQLPKNASNVMVIELGHIHYSEEDLIDSLFGDERVVISKEDFSAKVVRGKEKIFTAKKNTRLSAVLYYKKKFVESGFQVWKSVLYNPFASNPISPSFFEDKNVRQLVLIEDKKGRRMEWLKKE